MAKKLIPKRKIETIKEESETNIHTSEDYQIINTLEIIDGGFTFADFLNGIFSHRFGIPFGADKYG